MPYRVARAIVLAHLAVYVYNRNHNPMNSDFFLEQSTEATTKKYQNVLKHTHISIAVIFNLSIRRANRRK